MVILRGRLGGGRGGQRQDEASGGEETSGRIKLQVTPPRLETDAVKAVESQFPQRTRGRSSGSHRSPSFPEPPQ